MEERVSTYAPTPHDKRSKQGCWRLGGTGVPTSMPPQTAIMPGGIVFGRVYVRCWRCRGEHKDRCGRGRVLTPPVPVAASGTTPSRCETEDGRGYRPHVGLLLRAKSTRWCCKNGVAWEQDRSMPYSRRACCRRGRGEERIEETKLGSGTRKRVQGREGSSPSGFRLLLINPNPILSSVRNIAHYIQKGFPRAQDKPKPDRGTCRKSVPSNFFFGLFAVQFCSHQPVWWSHPAAQPSTRLLTPFKITPTSGQPLPMLRIVDTTRASNPIESSPVPDVNLKVSRESRQRPPPGGRHPADARQGWRENDGRRLSSLQPPPTTPTGTRPKSRWRAAEFPMLLVADATQCRICVFMHARSISRAIPNGQSESSGSSPDIPSQGLYSDDGVLSHQPQHSHTVANVPAVMLSASAQ